MKQPRLKRLTWTVIRILVTILIVIACLEALLTWVDPWGVVTYYSDIEFFFADDIKPDSALEYRVAPGEYTLRRWSFRINEDGGRNLPANPAPRASRCKIAFLGDSVAFGWGVNDSDTWVNRIAAEFPAVEFFDPALPGYNIASVRRLRHRYVADGYIYILINNDDEPIPLGIEKSSKPAIRRYIEHARHSGVLFAFERPKAPDFDGILAELVADPKLTVVGFAGNPLTERVAKQYPQITVLPIWTHPISVADAHPDVQGNQEVAAQMLPIVARVVRDRCN